MQNLANILGCSIEKLPTTYLGMPLGNTLINAVLNSLPTYVVSFFPLPAKVRKKLDRLRRRIPMVWQQGREGVLFYELENSQTSKITRGTMIEEP
ncbi:hypothetical protein H5410_023237 [Solanum commersonii]|uniref:Uncharacterized protein n=1 Tax=Solanum commersonii TaxID=4109 RepID=A0A9J5ZJB3_SOLCO|nr:hypothetical protein H5410_023237 [Solanum commersonii]